jgi:hypothetical protein
MQQPVSRPKRSIAAALLVTVLLGAVCWFGTHHADAVTGAFAAAPSLMRPGQAGPRAADASMISWDVRQREDAAEREANMKKAAELRSAYLAKVAAEENALTAEAQALYGSDAKMRPRGDPEASYINIAFGPFFGKDNYQQQDGKPNPA